VQDELEELLLAPLALYCSKKSQLGQQCSQLHWGKTQTGGKKYIPVPEAKLCPARHDETDRWHRKN